MAEHEVEHERYKHKQYGRNHVGKVEEALRSHMRVADIWINEPFEDIGTDKACFVASQRDYEEIADDDRE
ncbi:hypothetical protein LAC30SC_09465 [Lactobacillus amylovorus]|uniref:Uncharacterized protein n=1 Tax=Lactobacillus amylovorus TaxID=1604 RepID=F0TGZ8_LACAM|nr:hypothetical protein LAC30SC_09465 [Lactobacillus amylovorus]